MRNSVGFVCTARSEAGLKLTASSCPIAVFPEWARDNLADAAWRASPCAMTAEIKKLTPITTFWHPQPSQSFFHSLTPNLIFPLGVRQTAPGGSELALQFVAQPFLMPVRLHAFAALVFGNFCLPSFF
jgi:hypothetical protein